MRITKLLALFVLPLLIGGCQNKSSSEEPVQNLISLSETSIVLPEDRTHQLELTIDDSLKNYLVFWNMRDESIATVEDGLVTAISVGVTICTVQVGTYTANCTVTVVNYEPDPVLNIALATDTFSLNVNDTFELPVRVNLGNEIITDYTLTGDITDTSVVSFSNGVVTGLSTGETDILLTATYEDYVAYKLVYITVY